MKTKFVCQNCGYESGKWMGRCSSCDEWDTFEEEVVIESKKSSKSKNSSRDIVPVNFKTLSQVEKSDNKRFSSGFQELDRVLGSSAGFVDLKNKSKPRSGNVSESKLNSGFVPGQVILLSGEPGVGKSTLLLELALKNVLNKIDTVYVSGEESEGQIALRAERILSGKLDDKLKLVNAYNVETIINALEQEKPKFVIIDSIQTIFSEDSASLPGSVSQVKVCSNKLVNFAKSTKTTMVIVGHINKEGSIAGPKILEHLVDTVFQIEGDDKSELRLLRSLKNRFGPTMEVGMFRMTEKGMEDLLDPSNFLYSKSTEDQVGVCHSVIIEGKRPLVIEIQALTAKTPFALPKRVAEGIPLARLQRIAAILSKYTSVNLSDKDIYIKIAGGLKVQDPAIDVPIALAILSSAKDKKIPYDLVALGELNLTGAIADGIQMKARHDEARRLGYKKVIDKNSVKYISKLLDQI